MSGIKGSIEQGLVKALGKVRSAPTVSQFLSNGVLTPEEFIEADKRRRQWHPVGRRRASWPG